MTTGLAGALGWDPGFSAFGPIEVVELDVAKALVPKSQRREGGPSFAGYVGGWMSTGREDWQGDEIDVYGCDVSKFLRDGYFNDNHSRDQTRQLGYPIKCEVREHPNHGPSLWTEGPLFDTPRAHEVMGQIRAVHGTDRAYGFSVEGPPPVRDRLNPKRILRATILNAAITHRPVNEDARITLVKSLGALPLRAVEALLAFQKTDPAAAEELLGLYKAMMAGEPTGNTASGGAALQRESVGYRATPPPNPNELSLEEAVEAVFQAVANRGWSRDKVRAWLLAQARRSQA